ncbi:MAG: sulfite exporter TauE/SafE family protein [Nodularia sp. (in: Bacteria)]|nr:MAG: sulfite exporter TauE/SafE family protein [Nodularia sp. (in: cyanobacteria)]
MKNHNLFSLFTKIWFSRPLIRVSTLVAFTVWTVWLIGVGPNSAISNMIEHWKIAVTMVFGSMIAGGTSMGGGAVAFPVLTKVLQIPAHEARVFSLAIQTIGMGSASLTIVAMGTPLEWQFIRWVSLGGVPGIILSSVFLAPIIPPNVIKISFTIMISSFAIILLFLNRSKNQPNLVIQSWGKWERKVSFFVGLIGGIISGLVGSGMDIFAFSVMVLLFGVCEKVSTPNSVVLMAINTAVGFFLHKFILGNFVEPVSNYWLAAVPVVVVGAPLGAMLCTLVNRTTVLWVLISLIFVELVSSLLLVPLTLPVIYTAIFAFILFLSLFFWMYRARKLLSVKNRY